MATKRRKEEEYDNNVFHRGYARGFGKIPLFFRRWKWAWQRIIKGYCDYDIYNLDVYYAKLFEDSITTLKEITMTVPYGLTEEAWDNILTDIAHSFHESQRDDLDDAEWTRLEAIFEEKGSNSPEYAEAKEEWLVALHRMHLHNERSKRRGFRLLSKWFFDLWS